jgi:hypothetical protein
MENVIFLNHKERQCGVYQYGKRSADILKKSTKYNFIYIETESENDFWYHANTNNSIAIIYNYHVATMPWLGRHSTVKYPNTTHYLLHHEGSKPSQIQPDYYLIVDSTYIDSQNMFSIPRPLFENYNINYPNNDIPVISSFGFGFGNKGFGRVVKTVNDQFDEAIIRLQIPRAFYGDRNGEASAGVFPGCQAEVKKPGIKLQITTDFLDDQGLLNFLASSTANVFLYDEMKGRGLSSVIDYALSVNVPIVINNSDMFRHIKSALPSICIENRSLLEIISSGPTPLQQYRDKWSHTNFIKKYETIIEKTRKR